MKFAGAGMLGHGLYGAPDPRKSLQYCHLRDTDPMNFMFICRFNLAGGPGRARYHQNQTFDECCIYDDAHVVVLWLLKVEEER